VRIEEKGVHAPRIRLDPPVHVFKRRCRGELTTMLFFDVFDMGAVFNFSVVNP
jgi:hypothetical protein